MTMYRDNYSEEIVEEDMLQEEFDDFLDDEYEVTICGVSLCASEILKNMDEIAYREGFRDWIDMLVDDERLTEL